MLGRAKFSLAPGIACRECDENEPALARRRFDATEREHEFDAQYRPGAGKAGSDRPRVGAVAPSERFEAVAVGFVFDQELPVSVVQVVEGNCECVGLFAFECQVFGSVEIAIFQEPVDMTAGDVLLTKMAGEGVASCDDCVGSQGVVGEAETGGGHFDDDFLGQVLDQVRVSRSRAQHSTDDIRQFEERVIGRHNPCRIPDSARNKHLSPTGAKRFFSMTNKKTEPRRAGMLPMKNHTHPDARGNGLILAGCPVGPWADSVFNGRH